ncbi:MAG: hypothetical protein CMH54_09780 [Myxococcales bacterium]|nr:hypothetical protein [Myxococcales bacterium]
MPFQTTSHFFCLVCMTSLLFVTACEDVTTGIHSDVIDAIESDSFDAGSLDDPGTSPADTTTELPDTNPIPDDVVEDGTDTSQPLPSEPSPSLYTADRIHSPITPFVAQNLHEIAELGPEMQDNVFMKVGASSTVSSRNLKCLAGNTADLGNHTDLQETLDYFMTGDAAGTTPYERTTIAAKVGHSAGWVISGAPSPLQQEVQAIAPRMGLVHYGTNDMGLGTTHESAMWNFGTNMLDLIDELIAQGIIPILIGISPRGDSVTADRWVHTYNAIIRGLAQARQVPFIDLQFATAELSGFGLAGDGVHLNTFKEDGSYQACVFTDEGLAYGFNMRNLISLQALDRVRNALVNPETIPDDDVFLTGDGSPEAPFLIPHLPFSHRGNTALSPHSNLNVYGGCDADQDESGPELMYRLDLEETTRLRAMVFDRGDVDVDLHLLDNSPTEGSCIERAHQIISGTFEAGTYLLSLDTFVSGGTPRAGEYVLVVNVCHPEDPTCD